MKSNVIDLSVQFQHATDRAICIRDVESGPDIWIPKSLCEIDPAAPARGQVITLTTDESTAIDRGLV